MTPVVRRMALIVGVGLLTGVLTQIGQGALPDGWSQAANAISPWLLVAFGIGAVMPDRRWAVAAGVTSLGFALVGYYLMATVRFGVGGGTASLIFWSIGSLAGGSVFGLAGQAWRTGPRLHRGVAIGLLAGATIAEGVYQAQLRDDPSIGYGFILAGMVVPLLVGRSWQDRAAGYLATVPALILGAIGFVVFLRIYDLIPGILV